MIRCRFRSAAVLALYVVLTPSAPTVAQTLEPWTEGTIDIHHITTGRGNATLLILPDGTSVLVDAGAAPERFASWEIRPDGSRPPGDWIARYVERALAFRDTVTLDYALITHFHGDHMGGFIQVASQLDIDRVLDRGWPDYDYPQPLGDDTFLAYRRFMDAGTSHRERFAPGRSDQIQLRYRKSDYPSFEIRNLTANGEYWTGEGDATRSRFPPLESLEREDYPSENMCSLSFRLRYGAFDYYTGGDLTGIPNIGHPPWQNMEDAIADIVGPVDVHVVNHHGSIDPASPAFLAALTPRVHIIPSWAPTHPAPSVLKRLLSPRAYDGPRDVFLLQFYESTKAAIGPRATQVQSDGGHVLVRVAPGGGSYRIFVLSDADESGRVLASPGPYPSR